MKPQGYLICQEIDEQPYSLYSSHAPSPLGYKGDRDSCRRIGLLFYTRRTIVLHSREKPQKTLDHFQLALSYHLSSSSIVRTRLSILTRSTRCWTQGLETRTMINLCVMSTKPPKSRTSTHQSIHKLLVVVTIPEQRCSTRQGGTYGDFVNFRIVAFVGVNLCVCWHLNLYFVIRKKKDIYFIENLIKKI